MGQDLQNKWRQRIHVRADAAATLLIEQLPQRPILDARDAAALTGRTEHAARTALAQLGAAGIVEQIGSGEHNRVWAATELIELIETQPPRWNEII